MVHHHIRLLGSLVTISACVTSSLIVSGTAQAENQDSLSSFPEVSQSQALTGLRPPEQGPALDSEESTYLHGDGDYTGGTTVTYDFSRAVKEYVYIDTGIDSDSDGVTDLARADIIRPSDEDLANKGTATIPTIIDASPYWAESWLAKGYSNSSDPENSTVSSFYGFIDNYFEPRGYAYIALDILGTGLSQGCTDMGGEADTAATEAVVKWLNGDAIGYKTNDDDRSESNKVSATWSSGSVGFEGMSYDGSLPFAAASTGVEGLKTIVPIDGISSWYKWFRINGNQFSGWWEPMGMAKYLGDQSFENSAGHLQAIWDKMKARRQLCTANGHWTAMDKGADLSTRNYNDFWRERDYVDNIAEKYKGSVFLIQGVNDLNVKTDNIDELWTALQDADIPSKIWLSQNEHEDPLTYRQTEYLETLHKWFDYWLMDIDNGIMDEPQASLENNDERKNSDGNGIWDDYASWPVPGTNNVTLQLSPKMTGTSVGALLGSGTTNQSSTQEESFSGARIAESSLINTLVSDNAIPERYRLAYVSKPLDHAGHISGTPSIKLKVKSTSSGTNLTFALVDYSAESMSRIIGGSSYKNYRCPGEGDGGCIWTTQENRRNAQAYVITRGYMSTTHKDDLTTLINTPVNEYYDIAFDALATDYTVQEGHQLGLVIFNNSDRLVDTINLSDFTVDLSSSTVTVPISGLAWDANKLALEDAVDAAEQLVEDNYASASWQAFAQALADAQQVVSDPDATQDQVDAALEALTNAQAGLQWDVDTSALEDAVDAAEQLVEDNYASASWQAFAQALADAQQVVSDPDATQDQVDAALDALTNAQAGLQELPQVASHADTLVVRRGNTFYFKNSLSGGSADKVVVYGKLGDTVLVGDWDGDGIDTLALKRGNRYYIKNSLSGGQADKVVVYGKASDTPVVGDWNGDGIDTLAVKRGNAYYLKDSLTGGTADRVLSYGKASDTPLAGDWDGDGIDTLALKRGNRYYVKYSLTGGTADTVFAYGKLGDTPLVGDWDGDGIDTLAVKRGNAYHIKNSLKGGSADKVVHYGKSGDTAQAGDWKL